MNYRTRYAPSPTGEMHLGHARTALVTWLRARQAKGQIVMRIEDLDPPRVKADSESHILRDHEWLGLDWDEGPVHQSKRTALYEEALETIRERTFRCSCTRRELREASAPHEGEEGPSYPGNCYEGPRNADRPPAIRFRMEKPSPGFVDALSGVIPPGTGEDDFILRRSDGLFAYQFAVVVDDADARITEVIRGDDLLSSTPKQIALFRALGKPEPAWLHLPLVLDADRERLAKRHGAPAVSAYRAAGWSKEALLGVLAGSLGIGDGSPARLDELLDLFSLDAVLAASASNILPPVAGG